VQKNIQKSKKPIAFLVGDGLYKTVATLLLGQKLLSPEHTHAHTHGHGNSARCAIGVLGAKPHDLGRLRPNPYLCQPRFTVSGRKQAPNGAIQRPKVQVPAVEPFWLPSLVSLREAYVDLGAQSLASTTDS